MSRARSSTKRSGSCDGVSREGGCARSTARIIGHFTAESTRRLSRTQLLAPRAQVSFLRRSGEVDHSGFKSWSDHAETRGHGRWQGSARRSDQSGSTVKSFPPNSHVDGAFVTMAAIAAGLSVLMLPRQIIIASARSSPIGSGLAFAHGVPAASSMSAVTYAQDKRLRRALLERAEVPVPKGATFSIRSIRKAVEFSERVGYPVIVREAVGENPARTWGPVSDETGLLEAFQEARVRDPGAAAPGRNPESAGYAQTRLDHELDERGRQVSPARTRFLVERYLGTEVLRIYSSCSALRIAVRWADGAWQVPESVDDSLFDLADRARSAIPGLAVASVDLVADPPSPVGWSVVDLCERVRLASYLDAHPDLGHAIAEDLVTEQASSAGMEPPTTYRWDHVANVRAEVTGLARPAAADALLGILAEEHEVDLEPGAVDSVRGVAMLELQGMPRALAETLERLMGGVDLPDRASGILVGPFASTDSRES